MSKIFQKILWATDFSEEAEEALQYAHKWARMFDAELLALHVVPDFSPVLYNTATVVKGELIRRVDLIKQEAKQRLQELSDSKDINFRILVNEGNAAKKIIETVEEEQADLIVMGKRGMTALEKLFIGSVTSQILRNSPVPLLLTRAKSGEPAFDKILVPTDFSEHEEIEREFAWQIAGINDSELVFLHVLELHNHEFPPAVLEKMMAELEQKMLQRKKREKEDIRITEDVIRSINASAGITEYAEENKFDLIVLSTCGPGALERFFLGSTAEKVTAHSMIPVFAIPSIRCKK